MIAELAREPQACQVHLGSLHLLASGFEPVYYTSFERADCRGLIAKQAGHPMLSIEPKLSSY
jgi:hypothetical protein